MDEPIPALTAEPITRLTALPPPLLKCVLQMIATLSRDAISASGSSTVRTSAFLCESTFPR